MRADRWVADPSARGAAGERCQVRAKDAAIPTYSYVEPLRPHLELPPRALAGGVPRRASGSAARRACQGSGQASVGEGRRRERAFSAQIPVGKPGKD